MPTGPRGVWVPHKLGPLETYFRPGYRVSDLDGDLNRLRRDTLYKELEGLGLVLKVEYPEMQPTAYYYDLTNFIGYLRQKYIKKYGLSEEASFKEIGMRIQGK